MGWPEPEQISPIDISIYNNGFFHNDSHKIQRIQGNYMNEIKRKFSLDRSLIPLLGSCVGPPIFNNKGSFVFL